MRIGPAAFLVGLLVACSPSQPPPVPPLDAPPVDLERIRLADVVTWQHRRDIDADIDGDGSAERLVLAADVTTDDRGRAMWEDGHRWALFVEDGEARTLLYGAFVPNGHVEAAVLTAHAGSNRRDVLVRERTAQQSRSFIVAYDGRSARTVSAAYAQVENWLPSLTDP